MAEQPTIEELQNQLVELRKQNEQNKTELDALKKANSEMEHSLKDARDLNSKLILNSSSVINEETPIDNEEETVESVVADMVDSINANYLKRYKHD